MLRSIRLVAGETDIHQAEQLLQSALPLLLHHHVLHVDVGCQDAEPENQGGDHHPSDDHGIVGVTLAQHVLHLQPAGAVDVSQQADQPH